MKIKQVFCHLCGTQKNNPFKMFTLKMEKEDTMEYAMLYILIIIGKIVLGLLA